MTPGKSLYLEMTQLFDYRPVIDTAVQQSKLSDAVHSAFLDLTQKVSCCYGQCDDNGGGLFAEAGQAAVPSTTAR